MLVRTRAPVLPWTYSDLCLTLTFNLDGCDIAERRENWGQAGSSSETGRLGAGAGSSGAKERRTSGPGRVGMMAEVVASAEGRATVPGGLLEEVVVGFSNVCIETVSVNGCEYGAALMGGDEVRRQPEGRQMRVVNKHIAQVTPSF